MSLETPRASQTVIYTIGHSDHRPDRLVKLLVDHQIQLIVDVRSHPGSRRVPHANASSLRALFGVAGMQYLPMGHRLGGRPTDPSCYDRETGKPDYGAMQHTPSFREGLAQLVGMASTKRVCIMCAEEDPARCHRMLLIGMALQRMGLGVTHIRGDGAAQPTQELETKQLRARSAQLALPIQGAE